MSALKLLVRVHGYNRLNKSFQGNLKQTMHSFSVFTTLCQAASGGAVKNASDRSGWWETTQWGAPGSLVKLCHTIITHPSLIAHPSSPSPLTGLCSPCNYCHSWCPNWRNQIFHPTKMTDMFRKQKKKGRDNKWVSYCLLNSIGKACLRLTNLRMKSCLCATFFGSSPVHPLFLLHQFVCVGHVSLCILCYLVQLSYFTSIKNWNN